MDPYEIRQVQRRRQLKDFNRKAKLLLPDVDRKKLYGSLRDYQMYHSIDDLVNAVLPLLDTPTKLDLLKDIRNFVPAEHVRIYDSLCPYQKMAHPFPSQHHHHHQPQYAQVSPSLHYGGYGDSLLATSQLSPSSMHYNSLPHGGHGAQNSVPHNHRNPNPNYGSTLTLTSPTSAPTSAPPPPRSLPQTPARTRVPGAGTTVVRYGTLHSVVADDDAGASVPRRALSTQSLNRPVSAKKKKGGGRGGGKAGGVMAQDGSGYGTVPRNKRRIVHGPSEQFTKDPNLLRVIHIQKDSADHIGFSVRGGSEHGLGIFVSEVEDGSAADSAGLEVGDNIVEVNAVSFECVASSSAVKVLTGADRLKLVVRRIGKIPGFKSAKEKTSWYDVNERMIVDGHFEEHGSTHHPGAGAGAGLGLAGNEKRIHLTMGGGKGSRQSLGFNIRGGAEYGLGIYVSKVDTDGLAERGGLHVGDQIVEVNQQSMEGLTHADAVELMRASRQQLVMKVRDVGKYPAFKEIYAEYRWIDVHTGHVTKTRTYKRQLFGTSGNITSIPVMPSQEETLHNILTEFPMDTSVNALSGTDTDESLSEIMVHLEPGATNGNQNQNGGIQHGFQDGGIQHGFQDGRQNDIYGTKVDVELDLREDEGLGLGTQTVVLHSSPKYNKQGPKTATPKGKVILNGDGSVKHSPKNRNEQLYRAKSLPSVVDGHNTNPTDNQTPSNQSNNQSNNQSKNHTNNRTDNGTSHQLRTGPSYSYSDHSIHDIGGIEVLDNGMDSEGEEPDIAGYHRRKKLADDAHLMPKKSDVVMLQRQSDSEDETDTGVELVGVRKTSSVRAPKATLAVQAMQNEARRNHPDIARQMEEEERRKKEQKELVNSLRGTKRGKQSMSSGSGSEASMDSKKSLTLKERLFGTKSRSKAPKSKSRQPLSNVDFNHIGEISEPLQETVHLNAFHVNFTEQSSKLLNLDEVTAVEKHVKVYENGGEVDALVPPLLAILDTPEKMQLLVIIRMIIREEDRGSYDSLIQQHMMSATPTRPPRTKRTAPSKPMPTSQPREEIPQLRKANIRRDTEEIVRPTVPEAQHDYEIRRLRSNSHVYKAKMDTPNLNLKSANQNTPNSQPLKSTNQHPGASSNSTNQHGDVNELSQRSTNQNIGIDYATNGNYSASSESLYATQSNYGSQDSLDNILRATTQDNTYETVEPQTHLPVAKEPDTFSNPPDPVFDESDEVLQSDSMAVANEALNFLEELDVSQNDEISEEEEEEEEDYRRAPSPRSDISASSAATTRYGSYDINLDTSGSSGAGGGDLRPGTRDTGKGVDSNTGGSGLGLGLGVNTFSENSIDRRNPPQFIPPPPPLEPPPSDSETSPRTSETSPRSMSETSPRTSGPSASSRDYHGTDDSDRETPLKSLERETPLKPTPNNRNQFQSHSLPSLTESEGVNSLRAAKRAPRTVLQPSLGLSIAPAFEDYSLDDVNANPAPPPPPPLFKDDSPTKEPETFDFLNNYTKELGFPIRCTTPTRHKDTTETNSSFLHHHRNQTTTSNHSKTSYTNPKPNSKPNHTNHNQFARSVVGNRDRSTVAVEVQAEEVSEFFEPSDLVPAGAMKVQVPKASKSLGIAISGGNDSRSQPFIKVREIYPNGAVAMEGTIKKGMRILSIDGASMTDVSHAEAVDVIRTAFANRSRNIMTFIVKP